IYGRNRPHLGPSRSPLGFNYRAPNCHTATICRVTFWAVTESPGGVAIKGATSTQYAPLVESDEILAHDLRVNKCDPCHRASSMGGGRRGRDTTRFGFDDCHGYLAEYASGGRAT